MKVTGNFHKTAMGALSRLRFGCRFGVTRKLCRERTIICTGRRCWRLKTNDQTKTDLVRSIAGDGCDLACGTASEGAILWGFLDVQRQIRLRGSTGGSRYPCEV